MLLTLTKQGKGNFFKYCVYRSHNWRLESNPQHRRYSSQSPVTNHLRVSSRLAAAQQHTTEHGAPLQHSHSPAETRHPSCCNQCVTTVRQSAGIPAFRPTLHQHFQKYLELTEDKNIIYTRKKIINKPYKNTHYISTQCMEEQNSAVDCSSCSYMILVQFKRRHC